MMDSGWEHWADRTEPDGYKLEAMANDCVLFLQRKPDRQYMAMLAGSALAIALRHSDGSIQAYQADVRAERMLEP